jgi:hypothetical protein
VLRSFEKVGTCWVSAAAHRYKNLSHKVRPRVALFTLSVVQQSCFCRQVLLIKFCYERRACCGFAEWVLWRLGQGWVIRFVGSFRFNQSETAVFESPGRRFPTPAGVMARLVANKECRNGLGDRVASHSNP